MFIHSCIFLNTLIDIITHLFASLPWKYAWTVSENATARGIVSENPMVNGLGPREVPKYNEEPETLEFICGTLSDLSERKGSGV